jgi:hypothetical protein
MPSMARDAKMAGYSTAYFGKVHLGSFADNHPGVHGYDQWIGSETNIPTYDPSCYCKTNNVCGLLESLCENPFCYNQSLKCHSEPIPTCSTGYYPANFFQPQMWCGMKNGNAKASSAGIVSESMQRYLSTTRS